VCVCVCVRLFVRCSPYISRRPTFAAGRPMWPPLAQKSDPTFPVFIARFMNHLSVYLINDFLSHSRVPFSWRKLLQSRKIRRPALQIQID